MKYLYALFDSVLAGFISFIIGGGYCAGKFMEGWSQTSGFRQEQQNKEIIEELKKMNKL